MTPLISAIAAGCCAILKPSEHTPAVSRIIDEMIHQTFENKYITTVHGDHRVGQHLIQLPFDLIFFTGSTAVGKIVLKAAAENMTPVILELGGKSPCIVDKTANLTIAARRIAWGKGLNSGQTCIAPDYLFVEASIYSKFLDALKNAFRELYGDNIIDSKYYTRIIHEQAYDRLENLLNSGNIYSGGVTDKSQRFISPAILQDVKPTEPIMKEEIFGPLLPILPFSNLMDAIDYINAREKPLALYFFGNEEVAEKVITKTTSGGICINDTILHIANQHLPFGGVGKSGMGKYRGKAGFEAFSHARAIVKAPKWIDLPFRYPPFRYFRWIRKLI